MSSDLAWLLTRNTASYLVANRSNATILSKKSLNGRNSYKQSPVNAETVAVAPAGKGFSVALTTEKGKKYSAVFKKSAPRMVAPSVRNLLKKQRVDLTKDTLARVSAVLRAQKPGKPVNKARKLRGKKAVKA